MQLPIYRDTPEGLALIGTLSRKNGVATFQYSEDYLTRDDAAPVSLSLPLTEKPYEEEALLPYFKGLLPEGEALENLCRSLGILTTDYFTMLQMCGLDCLGDIIINPEAYQATRAYEPLTLQEVKAMAGKPKMIDESLERARLSLAGTQSKCGLFHDPQVSLEKGWYQPRGGAPSNYIVKFAREDLRDLMTVEHLVMTCAHACGVPTARTALIDPLKPVICVERYDRLTPTSETVNDLAAPRRRHQEDITQAFGIKPQDKYHQLKPSTIAVLSDFFRKRSAQPAQDIAHLARIVLYNYLIGNCDNHLKNLSILYAPDWQSFQLAPAYDLVSTTYFARFTSTMGMALGDHLDINEVTPSDFSIVADHLGVALRLLRSIAQELAEKALPALREESARLEGLGFDDAPYIADDIEEDVYPRLEVLLRI